jgi:hypothetical protein
VLLWRFLPPASSFFLFVDVVVVVVVDVLLKLYDEAKLTMTHEIGFRSLLVNVL